MPGFSGRQLLGGDASTAFLPQPNPQINQLADVDPHLMTCQANLTYLNKQITVNALIDTGNSIPCGAAIGEKVARELNITVDPTQQIIRTAKQGSEMTVSGRVKTLQLTFQGHPEVIILKDVLVIPTLEGDINLGAAFLKDNDCTIAWRNGSSHLQLGKQPRKPIQFQNNCSDPGIEEKRELHSLLVLASKEEGLINVSINKDVELERLTGYRVTLMTTNLPEGSSIYVPTGIQVNNLDVMDGIFRITKKDSHQKFTLLFLNNTEEKQVLKKGKNVFQVYTCSDQGIRLKPPVNSPEIVGSINKISGKTVTLHEKEKEILNELKIESNEYLNQNPDIKHKATALILKYADVFTPSSENKVGVTELLDLKLRMKPGPVIRQKVRPMNPKMKESADQQIQDWLKDGVISPSVSEYSSPLVPVKKKDGSIRWCVDFRQVNDRIEHDSFPIPKIEELVQGAAGYKLYSALDCFAAYNHIRVHKDSKKYTAFSTPDGHYEFDRMPFGLKPAVSVFSRFIVMAMSGVSPEHIKKYLDDMLTHTNDPMKHLEVLEELFQRHQEVGLKLKPSKTLLFQTKVDYLGHQLSQDGIAMVPEYLDKILNWPDPTNKKALNHMLGMFGYYRAFIPKFAYLTKDMNSMKSEKATFTWTSQMSQQLAELKEAFRKSQVRTFPDYKSGKPFILTIDFSCEAIGVTLSQEQNGEIKLIAAAGRKTTEGEKNYSSWKGEYAALVYGIRKFEHILSFAAFEVKTDSSTLTHRAKIKPTTGILARWMEYLAGFEFKVTHISGKSNVVADAISRTPEHLDKPSQEEEEESAEYAIHQLEMSGIKDRPSSYVLNLTKFTGKQLERAQKRDMILSQVYQWIQDPTTREHRRRANGLHQDLQFYRRLLPSISLVTTAESVQVLGQVYKTWLGETRIRLLIPEELRHEVFQATHQHSGSGHWDLDTAVNRARNYFVYPGMRTDMAARYMVCQTCLQRKKNPSLKQRGYYPERAAYAMQRLYIDLYGPLPEMPRHYWNSTRTEGKGGISDTETYKYILSIEDSWSRFVSLVPIPDKSAVTVASCLNDNFLGTFGMPAELYSDQGKEFCNQVFAELEILGKYKHIFSIAYNPQANKVERFHRNLTCLLTIELEREDTNWIAKLPAIQMAYNSKVHRSTGVTPALAFLGRELKIPLALIAPVPGRGSETSWIGQLKDRYNKIFAKMYQHQTAQHLSDAKMYSNAKTPFQVGDLVWHWTKRQVQKKPLKLTQRWCGLYRVIEVVNDISIRIQSENKPGKPILTSAHYLEKYTGENIQHHDVPRGDEILNYQPDDEVQVYPAQIEIPAEMGLGAVAQNHRYSLRSKGFERPAEAEPPDPLEDELVDEFLPGPKAPQNEGLEVNPGQANPQGVRDVVDEIDLEEEGGLLDPAEELERATTPRSLDLPDPTFSILGQEHSPGTSTTQATVDSPIEHIGDTPNNRGITHSTPAKVGESSPPFHAPVQPRRLEYNQDLTPVPEEPPEHPDTPRPKDPLGCAMDESVAGDNSSNEVDPDETITAPDPITDESASVTAQEADLTINDGELAKVIQQNYDDESAAVRKRKSPGTVTPSTSNPATPTASASPTSQTRSGRRFSLRTPPFKSGNSLKKKRK